MMGSWLLAGAALAFCELVLVAVLVLGAPEPDEGLPPRAASRRGLLVEAVVVLAIVMLTFGLLTVERTIDLAAHVTGEKAGRR